MVGGLVVAVLCLLWVSQFFSGGDEVTPVIWIEDLRNSDNEPESESFGEWQE